MTSNSNSTKLAVLRLTDPTGLIEAVPYLIGFPPTNSVVFIGLTGDHGSHRLVLTARVDLDAVLDDDGLGRVCGALHRAGVTGVIVVVYDDEIATDPSREDYLRSLVGELSHQLDLQGLPVWEVLGVGTTEWWSLDGRGRGRRIGGSAEAIAAALPPPALTRVDLVAVLDPARDELAVLAADITDAESGPPMTAGSVLACAAELRAVGEAERVQWSSARLARCAVAVTDVAVRDVLWLALDAGPEQACGVEELALEIGTRCPGRYAAAGLFLFAWSRWRAGDGVLAAEAAQRAVAAAGGDYVAAELLLDALSMGLNPSTTPRLEHGGDAADEREL